MSLTEAQMMDLLDAVLYYYFENGNPTVEQVEPTLDMVVRTVAKREGLLPFASAEDLMVSAALAYEQLTAR